MSKSQIHLSQKLFLRRLAEEAREQVKLTGGSEIRRYHLERAFEVNTITSCLLWFLTLRS